MTEIAYTPAELRLLALKLGGVLTHPDERARLGAQAGAILYALADQMDAAAAKKPALHTVVPKK